jgi:hypothetical protein
MSLLVFVNYFTPNDMLFLLSLLSDIYKITQLILDTLLVGFVTSYCIKTLVGHELAGADSRLFQSIAVMA